MKNKAIFICGTDTCVGKTLITGSLCAWLNHRGVRAGAFKPVESGCFPGKKGMRRHLRRADSEFLKKMARMEEPINAINPYYFKEALAPGVAAKRVRKNISFKILKNRLQSLQKKYDTIFVEGAGGLLVPVNHTKTNLDLMREFQAPVLLIARLGLGTINHTLLTLEHLRRNRVKVLGVILNEITQSKSIAEKTNPGILKRYGVPLLGVFPYVREKTRENLLRAVRKIIGKNGLNRL